MLGHVRNSPARCSDERSVLPSLVMSERRALTDEEQKAAAVFKRLLLAACDTRTQEAIADEIGVTQGTIWQWAEGRIPVSAKRAQAAAKVVGGDPSAISVAFRDLNLPSPKVERPATARTKSHSATPDLDTLHEALTLLLHEEQQAGQLPPRTKTARLADLYARIAADGGRLTPEHNRLFMQEVDARRRGVRNGTKRGRKKR